MSKTYLMSVDERKEALIALREAYPLIWDGSRQSRASQTQYICFALIRTYPRDYTAAKELIERSLGGHYTYESWLKANGHDDASWWPKTKIQMERKRWVRHLIKCLSESLK